jgi:cobalt-zinc-cadmium efflux system protein
MSQVHKSDHEHAAHNVTVLKWALSLTFIFLVIEAAAGFISNSLALLSDAGHMLSDVLALLVSLYAAYLIRKAPTAQRSYGYYRTEVLAALFNGMLLCVIVGIITLEALQRFYEPHPVRSNIVMITGGSGLAINLGIAWLLHGHEDLNMKGAYYHVLADTLGSVGAVMSGVLIYLTGWLTFDPILSIVISLLVLHSSWTLIRDSINILMESTPKHLNSEAIRQSLLLCDGVENIHDLHVWSLGSRSHALSAHIVILTHSDPSEVRTRVEEVLRGQFHLSHTTLQMEILEACEETHD